MLDQERNLLTNRSVMYTNVQSQFDGEQRNCSKFEKILEELGKLGLSGSNLAVNFSSMDGKQRALTCIVR